MFEPLKSKIFWVHGAVVICAVAWLSGCGDMLGSGSRVDNSGGGMFGNNRGPGQNSGGSMQTRRPSGGTGGPDQSYDQTLQKCDQYRGAATNVVNACGSFFQSHLNDLSQGCHDRFNDLYNYDCDGLSSRLQGVFNACATDIREGMSYFPQECQTVLRSFMR